MGLIIECIFCTFIASTFAALINIQNANSTNNITKTKANAKEATCDIWCFEPCQEHPNEYLDCVNINRECQCWKRFSFSNPLVVYVIVGGVCGTSGIISLCGLIYCWVKSKRSRQRRQRYLTTNQQGSSNPMEIVERTNPHPVFTPTANSPFHSIANELGTSQSNAYVESHLI